MEDVAGVHSELVTSGNTITINVFVRTTGAAVSITLKTAAGKSGQVRFKP